MKLKRGVSYQTIEIDCGVVQIFIECDSFKVGGSNITYYILVWIPQLIRLEQ